MKIFKMLMEYEMLLEYNKQALSNTFGKKFADRWKNDDMGIPYNNSLSPEENLMNLLPFMEEGDPTNDKIYVPWVVKQFADGNISFNDVQINVKKALDKYDRLARKKKLEQKHIGINKFDYNTLTDVVNTYSDEGLESKKEKVASIEQEFLKNNEVEIILDNSTWKIVVPKSESASQYYGKNTKWCTAATKNLCRFKQYNKQGNLYYILHKPSNTRWAFHFEAHQFMDEEDKPIDLVDFFETYPELKPVFAKATEHLDPVKHPVLFVFNDYPEEVQIEAVKRDRTAIAFMKNPSEVVQFIVVNQAINAIQFIKNPTIKVQLYVVTRLGSDTIRYIKNPPEEVQIAAVKNSGFAIEYIKNPSETVQLAAVTQNGYAIQYIENPSDAVQLVAVKNEWRSIKYIDNPTENAQIIAVRKNAYAIKYINNPTEKVQLMVVKKNGHAIYDIKNPTEKVKQLHQKLWG